MPKYEHYRLGTLSYSDEPFRTERGVCNDTRSSTTLRFFDVVRYPHLQIVECVACAEVWPEEKTSAFLPSNQ